MRLPERIAVDPEIMMGDPCVKGTRIPVYVLLQKMAAGESEAEILQAYPQLRKADLIVAWVYAARAAYRRGSVSGILSAPLIRRRFELLAWAVQRGTALLTTSKTPSRINENFDISTLPEDAMKEISEGIKTRQRFNAVVETGVPGFIPRGK